MKRDRALLHASRIPLSLPLFRGRAPRVWHLGNATADERCGRSIRAPEAGGGGLKATAITRPPSPLPSWDARGIGNGECHQLPLRDSSGISPDSMRSQRVIPRSMDGWRDRSRQFRQFVGSMQDVRREIISRAGRLGGFDAVHGGADDAAGVARALAAGEQSGELRVLQGVVAAGDAHGRAGAGLEP